MHYFNLATNLCTRFTIGYPNDPANFYITGQTKNEKPIISCRVLDLNGEILYELNNNSLSTKSASYRLLVTKEGWHRITDIDGNELLLIETRMDNKNNRITYIRGEFHDKNRKLAAKGDERGLIVNCPLMM